MSAREQYALDIVRVIDEVPGTRRRRLLALVARLEAGAA